MNKLIKLAEQWREANNYTTKGGVIIIHDETVQGWCNELRDPDHWQPGCFAVDDQGHIWTATGGNASEGAVFWLES